MQVLFLQNVKGVARKGDVKNVKDGYFNNYLLPSGLAVVATAAVKKQAEKMRNDEVIQKERLLEEAREVVKKIDGTVVVLKAKAKGDKLYGSITEKEVIDALEAEKKVRLEKTHLIMRGNIKTTGTFDIHVKITDGAEAVLKVEVKGEE